jgi:hypothetical protein
MMMTYQKSRQRSIALAVFFAFCATRAFAERPMAVDDAGTLERGGAKLEFGWSRDDAVRGYEGAAGFGPIDKVEVELGFGRAKDRDADPDAKIHAVGAAVKWVPLQSELGLSAGLKYEYGRERASGVDASRADSLAALATWAFEQGPRVHLNLGREWVRNDADVNFWGVGLDVPLNERLDFVIETFGTEHAGPDRQVGLRYAIAEGVKISGAVGRGNDRNIGNVGVAWEF